MKKLYLSLLLPLVVFFAPVNERLSALRASRNASAVAATREADREFARNLRARIAGARRLLKQQPRPAPDSVTLAVEAPEGEGIQLLTIPKSTLLQQGAQVEVASSLGKPLKVRVVRPNFVNTAVSVTDAEGRELDPLAIEYPRTEGKDGKTVKEIAYYTSAHPAISAPALARDGRAYVRRTLDAAAAELAARGEPVAPDVVDIAERLCFVEHADHKRFMREDRPALFDEIATLYSLNAGDTYRYSVSTAGAGGMIQMIPQTYAAVREQHPKASLRADFVEGMQDHANAARAMLLYMQDTWRDLSRRDEIKGALSTGLATQAELLAAGYNSNSARLASYLERGGTQWRTLIPAETQMYLQIYAEVDAHSQPAE